MTKDELWSQYVARNPAFDGNGNVTMSAAGLRKLFDQTWDFGHDRGYANGKAFVEMQSEMQKESSSAGFKNPFDVFNNLYNRR